MDSVDISWKVRRKNILIPWSVEENLEVEISFGLGQELPSEEKIKKIIDLAKSLASGRLCKIFLEN